MTQKIWQSMLLASSVALLFIAPALAQGDDSGADEGTTTAPAPAPAFLPTGPAVVANPNESSDDSDFGRPRLAVIPFVETYSADGQIVATGAIGDILETELAKIGRFNIIAKKEDLKEMIQNAQIEQGSGMYDISTVPALGRYKGAELLFMGRISNMSFKSSNMNIMGFGTGKDKASCRIDFRIVKAETGEILYSQSGEGNGSSGSSFSFSNYGDFSNTSTAAGMFGGAIVSACKDIVTKIELTDIWPVRALIKGTAGDKVVIDLGQSTGLYPGLVLSLRDVDILRDDDTGEILAHDIGEVYGSLQLDEVQIDKAIGHVISGGKAKKGTLAEVPRDVTLKRPDESLEQNADDARYREEDKKKNKDKDDDYKAKDNSKR